MSKQSCLNSIIEVPVKNRLNLLKVVDFAALGSKINCFRNPSSLMSQNSKADDGAMSVTWMQQLWDGINV